jgi:hypothetical protein
VLDSRGRPVYNTRPPNPRISEDTVLRASTASGAAADESVAEFVILTCPRCGHVDRMLASSYAMWSDGILCGVCGPPYVKMHVRLVRGASWRQ